MYIFELYTINKIVINKFFGLSLVLFLLICYPNISIAQYFSEVADASGINFSREHLNDMGAGVIVFDYDNDGWEDFFLPGGYGNSALYRNNGDGTFSDVFQNVLNSSTLNKINDLFINAAIAGDIDNDGFRDLFLLCAGNKSDGGVIMKPSVLLKNINGATFSDITISAGITEASYGIAASMADFDLDGDLDIYVCNYLRSMSFIFDNQGRIIGYDPECRENFLYRNNGNSTFTEIAQQMAVDNAGCSLSAVFSDFDQDGDPDLLLANDFGEWNNLPNKLYENEPSNQTLVDGSLQTGFNRAMYGMGIAAGDFDEDGDLDYYVTNIGQNSLYQNNGDGTFNDIASLIGVDNTWSVVDSLKKTSWGCNFFDFNNDSNLDLFVASGYVGAATPPTVIPDSNRLFYNRGNGVYEDSSQLSGLDYNISNRGSAVFDYDHDGDLDLIVNHARMQVLNNGFNQDVRLFRNELQSGAHWIKIKLEGTISNKDAYGSLIKLYAGGRIFLREIHGGSSHASLNSNIAHFGLDDIQQVDSIIVFWPNSSVQKFYNLSVDQQLNIIEASTAIFQTEQTENWCKIFPTVLTSVKDLIIEMKLNQSSEVIFELYDFMGRSIECSEAVEIHEPILLNPFSNDEIYGVYWVQVKAGTKVFTDKIMIR